MNILEAEHFCLACSQRTPTQKFGCTHPLHVAISFVSLGYWLPIWLSLWAVSVALPYRCIRCQGRCGPGGNSIPQLIGAGLSALVLLIASLGIVHLLLKKNTLQVEIGDPPPQSFPEPSTIGGTETAEVVTKTEPGILPPMKNESPVVAPKKEDLPPPPEPMKPVSKNPFMQASPVEPAGPIAKLPPEPEPKNPFDPPMRNPSDPVPVVPVQPVPKVPVNPSPKWIANATIIVSKTEATPIATTANYLDSYLDAVKRGDTKASKKLIADSVVVLLTTPLPVMVESRSRGYAYLRLTEGEDEGKFYVARDRDAENGAPGELKK